MDLNKLMLEGLSDGEVQRAFINLMAFEGLKIATKGIKLGDCLVKLKVPPEIWRSSMAIFVGMPWKIHELSDEDYRLLQDVYEMLAI